MDGSNMPFIDWIKGKVHTTVYNPDDDPLIQERRNIGVRTDTLIRYLEETRQPSTGMTLADMAANRKLADMAANRKKESWQRSQ